MRLEICKRHKVDHTGTVCGACFELYKRKANKPNQSKLYYCENLTAEEVEQFYLLDTGFGVIVQLDTNKSFVTYSSIKEFKACWGNFDMYAQLTRVL